MTTMNASKSKNKRTENRNDKNQFDFQSEMFVWMKEKDNGKKTGNRKKDEEKTMPWIDSTR